MSCHYQVWNRELPSHGNHGDIRVSTILKGSLQYCGADSDASGLCPEHAAFVADCKATEVSKLDMKYKYRVPAKRKAKLAPPNVRETIIEPGHYAKQYALYEAAEGKDTYGVWFGKAIRPVKPEWTAENQAEKERADAEAKETERRAAEWKAAQAKMPDTSRPADLGKGINYIGDKPDTRPIGKRAAKIDRTIQRMTALC